MNTLRPRDDLLTANEDIKRVGVVRIVRRRHCVKRSGVEGIPREHVEVRAVLLLHQSPEHAFGFGADVAERIDFFTRLLEHLDPFLKRQSQRRPAVLQRLERVLLVHHTDFSLKSLVQAVEHAHEQLIEDIQHFVVVLLDGHFHVQPGELAQVSVRVRVFGAEHRSNLKHALQITHDGHLLV